MDVLRAGSLLQYMAQPPPFRTTPCKNISAPKKSRIIFGLIKVNCKLQTCRTPKLARNPHIHPAYAPSNHFFFCELIVFDRLRRLRRLN